MYVRRADGHVNDAYNAYPCRGTFIENTFCRREINPNFKTISLKL